MKKELYYNNNHELIDVRIDGKPVTDITISKDDDITICREPEDFFMLIKESGGKMSWEKFIAANKKWYEKCLEDVKKRMEG